MEILECRSGFLVFKLSGKDGIIQKFSRNEGGGHRWQRVPPTEKRGRTHTSTVTVATLREVSATEVKIDPRELEIKTTRGSGAGGQHRNTTDSAVVITHLPTKITVRAENGRSQHQNKATALEILRARLLQQQQKQTVGRRNAKRKDQVGTGMRADKIRTTALQRDQVTDHRSGKRISSKAYLRGKIEDLWTTG